MTGNVCGMPSAKLAHIPHHWCQRSPGDKAARVGQKKAVTQAESNVQ